MVAVPSVSDCLQYIVLDRHFMWEEKMTVDRKMENYQLQMTVNNLSIFGQTPKEEHVFL